VQAGHEQRVAPGREADLAQQLVVRLRCPGPKPRVTRYPISISRMTISILSDPISMLSSQDHIAYRSVIIHIGTVILRSVSISIMSSCRLVDSDHIIYYHSAQTTGGRNQSCQHIESERARERESGRDRERTREKDASACMRAGGARLSTRPPHQPTEVTGGGG